MWHLAMGCSSTMSSCVGASTKRAHSSIGYMSCKKNWRSKHATTNDNLDYRFCHSYYRKQRANSDACVDIACHNWDTRRGSESAYAGDAPVRGACSLRVRGAVVLPDHSP